MEQKVGWKENIQYWMGFLHKRKDKLSHTGAIPE